MRCLPRKLFDVAPTVVEYLPLGQGAVSRPPPLQNQPAGQVTVLIVDPSGQKKPAAQFAQANRLFDPADGLYVPIGQFKQEDKLEPPAISE